MEIVFGPCMARALLCLVEEPKYVLHNALTMIFAPIELKPYFNLPWPLVNCPEKSHTTSTIRQCKRTPGSYAQLQK